MEKVQLKGEAAEEELKALEMDVTGKVLTLKLVVGCSASDTCLDHACLMARNPV